LKSHTAVVENLHFCAVGYYFRHPVVDHTVYAIPKTVKATIAYTVTLRTWEGLSGRKPESLGRNEERNAKDCTQKLPGW